jgi:hypothetical protein
MDANNNLSLIDRLKQLLAVRDKTIIEFARETGIDKDKVYKWLKRGTVKIDHKEAAIIEQWISGQLSNIVKKVEPHTATHTAPDRDIIFNLTESNRMMAEAMLTDARNRESLTRSNERLTLKVTADDPQQTSQELTAIRQAVVEFVIEVASGKRYKDRHEAGQAYSKKVAELIEATKGKDTRTNLDKMHSALK